MPFLKTVVQCTCETFKSLPEAFRGMLELQSKFCVGQVSGKSVSSSDQSQVLVLLSHVSWPEDDLHYRTLRVIRDGVPLIMWALRTGLHSQL